MSGVGEWRPAAPGAERIEPQQLAQCADWGGDDSVLGALSQVIDAERQRDWAFLMRQPQSAWETAAAALDEEKIICLIRFFAAAEMQLPGWYGGDHSPVIWLARTLRQQNRRLSREMLLWLRSHSDNRYLPHGNVNALS